MGIRRNIISSIALILACGMLVSCAGTLNTKLDKYGNPIDEPTSITESSESSDESVVTSETSETIETSETSETSETTETSENTPTPTPPMDEDIELPPSYNLVELGYTSPIRDQGSYGSCQSITTLELAESRLRVQGVRDPFFSEWAFYKELNTFGNSHSSVGLGEFIASGNSIVIPNSEVTYPSDNAYGYSAEGYDLDPSLRGRQDYSITDVYFLSDESMSNDEIIVIAKTYLVRNYALSACFDMISNDDGSYRFFNSDLSALYTSSDIGHNEGARTNHMCMIVGYDDNYSKENFADTPSRDGAFLVQNSWGTYFGDDGFFWVSYDDMMMYQWCLFAIEVTSGDKIDITQGYDDVGYDIDWYGCRGSSSAFGTTSDSFAMKATAPSNMNINAVGLFTTVTDVEYTIYIDTTGNFGQEQEVGHGVIGNIGYHYVPLDTSTYVDAGTEYTIVVVYSTTFSSSLIAIDCQYLDVDRLVTDDVTFAYSGGRWADTVNYGCFHVSHGNSDENICFKVYGESA